MAGGGRYLARRPPPSSCDLLPWCLPWHVLLAIVLMARSGSSASPSDAITQLIAARDSLLVFERGSRDTEGTGVSGTNSTAPQGGPSAASAASGLFT